MFDYVKAVADRMPKMNRTLLVDFDKAQLENATSFIDTCFKWGTENLTDGSLKYLGYTVVSPLERAMFDLFGVKITKMVNRNSKDIVKKGAFIPAYASELQLIKYGFMYNNEKMYCYIYVPYIHNYLLHINGKRYNLQRGIVEKVFSRVGNKSYDGVMIRPIRARLSFYRHDQMALITVNDDYISLETIIRTVLHHKSHGRRKRETTIINYLLAKFGFEETLKRFGFNLSEISFVDKLPSPINDGYDYFYAVKDPSNNPIYLKMVNSLRNNPVARKLVANMLYSLTYFDIHTIESLMDPSGDIYRIILGLIIKPTSNVIKAKADMDSHIASVDFFIDPLSRDRFKSFGIQVDDIYELLIYIFIELDGIVANCHTQNLYEKRFDITDGVLIKAYAESIFKNFYNSNQRDGLKYSTVQRILKIDSMVLKRVYAQTQGGSTNITTAQQIYNDNALACLATKTRHIVSNDQGFHPSLMVVESLQAFSGKEVGRGGYVNPYVLIDPNNGSILHPDYAECIDNKF